MYIFPNLLNEDGADISDWTDDDLLTGVSEVDPAGQFRFDTNLGGYAGDTKAKRHRIIGSPPNQHTIEIKTYFDALGLIGDSDHALLSYIKTSWSLFVQFGSDGLFILKNGGSTKVGVNIVKNGGSAAWQTFRFQVSKIVEADAVVEVFLKEEGGAWASQGTFDCDYPTGGTDGYFSYEQRGYTTNNMVSHVDYIKVATGLGEIGDLWRQAILIF